MGSADLFSAGTVLLPHNSVLEFLKSSIVSAQAKEKYRSLLPSSSFSSWSKRERNDSKCEFPGWGSPEAPVAGDRCTELECLTGSSALLVWGETGGKDHGPELLLDTEGRRDEPWAETFADC